MVMNLNEIYICDTENNCTAVPDTEEFRLSKETYTQTEATLLNVLSTPISF